MKLIKFLGVLLIIWPAMLILQMIWFLFLVVMVCTILGIVIIVTFWDDDESFLDVIAWPINIAVKLTEKAMHE